MSTERWNETRPTGSWRRVLTTCLVVALGAASFGAASASASDKTLDPPTLDALHTAFELYDGVRVALAADDLEGVLDGALHLAGGLRHALAMGSDVPMKVQSMIDEAAYTAESMTEAEDLASARIAFGDVSQLLMQMAADHPRLVEGWHVFGCPMAVGFEKWMQPTAELENPYMGPSMLKCGGTSDWTVAAYEHAEYDAPAPVAAPRQAVRDEPEWKPGIPGLRMEDVRDHKFLWREIAELQVWERGNRLTVAEFRSKAIEKTAHFLGITGTEVDAFAAEALEAISDLRSAFKNRRATPESSGIETLEGDLEAATDRVTELLAGAPRHQLFAPEARKWLLKLAFGPKEAKEAEEARQAREAKEAEQARTASD